MIADLLELADDLSVQGPGGVRPNAVRLRRATSTAYYALFHALADMCVGQLVGWNKAWELVTPIYRSLEHRKARDVLNALRRERGSPFSIVASAFATLQDARQDADYDPRPFRGGQNPVRYSRPATQELVDTAKQAIRLLQQMSPEQKLTLAVRLVARSR